MTTPLPKSTSKTFEMDNKRDWKLCFQALVSKFNQEEYRHPIEVLDASGENVSIKITPDTLALLEETIFKSPDKLLQALPYTQQPAQTRKPKAPLPPVTKITSGIELLQQIFSERTLEIFCIQSQGGSKLWIDENKVLIREAKKNQYEHKHLQITITQIREALAKYSLDELRAAIAPIKSKKYRCLNDEKDSAEPYPHLNENNVNRIIGEVPNTDSSTTLIFIDYGLLLKFITAPHFEVNKKLDEHVIVTFSKSHLLAYLHTSLQSPLLVNIKPEQKGTPTHELKGNFIALGIPESPNELSEILFRFIIDISGSMQDSLEQLKKEIVKSIVNLIANGFGECTIQLIAFNDDFKQLPTNGDTGVKLSLDNQNINPCLTKFIAELNADATTRLTKAIEKGLRKHPNPHCNIITMIFTDGQDNNLQERNTIIPSIKRQLREDPNLPSMITIGWGQVDTGLLKEISDATGCQFINLKHDLSFDRVIMQALEKTESFTVLHLLLDAAKNFEQHMMVRDNEVRATKELMPFQALSHNNGKPKSVRINGKDIILTAKTQTPRSGCRFSFLGCCAGANSTTEEDQKKSALSSTNVELTFRQ